MNRGKVNLLVEGNFSPSFLQEVRETFFNIFKLEISEIFPLFSLCSPELRDEIAKRLVLSRVKNPFRLHELKEGLITPVELEYEKRRCEKNISPAYGMPYDGFMYCSVVRKITGEVNEPCVVLTDQLLVTYDEGDKRYHARYIILSFPSVISTGGLFEGPAKPKEYYLLRLSLSTLAPPETADALARAKFKSFFLLPDDPRLPHVISGNILQGLFYMIFGEGFCHNPSCRLFNFHFQEDLLKIHGCEKINLCEKHREMLKELQN